MYFIVEMQATLASGSGLRKPSACFIIFYIRELDMLEVMKGCRILLIICIL